jgi:hypothetical protein
VAETIGLRQTIALMGGVTLATVVVYAVRERRVQVLIERGTSGDHALADFDRAVT